MTTTGHAPVPRTAVRETQRPRLTLPLPPDDLEKYAYLQRNLPYLTTILAISATCLIISQLRFETQDPMLWPFMIFTGSYALYQVICLPVNFSGRGFDLAAHQARIQAWERRRPTPMWTYTCPSAVSRSRCWATAGRQSAGCWPLIRVRSRRTCSMTGPPTRPATWPRPSACATSGGPVSEFIRRAGICATRSPTPLASSSSSSTPTSRPGPTSWPRPSPTWTTPRLAIVQTPQFFREGPDQSWLENAAGSVQEVFYRSIQVARERFGAAVCVGTSALYRRKALEAQGGAALIPYAEDVHTGLNVMRDGWSITYLPIILATGICPNNLDAFVRQQYRWCAGNVGIVCSSRLWKVRMSLPARLTFISGFFYYVYTALLIFFGPLLPVVMLVFLPDAIQLRNFVILIPAFATGAVLYPLWHRAPYGPTVWPLGIARGWAHVFSLWDGIRGKSMSWHPTRTPGSSLPRFRIGVTWWSGGMAVLWVALALWRSTSGSWQPAALLFFGLLNLAVVSRVIFPGKATA